MLRFPNVSAHHCQFTLMNGYWYVRDLQSRNGVKVNNFKVTEKRMDPGDEVAVAKHRYQIQYSPAELGAVGPPPGDGERSEIFQKSLLEGAGLLKDHDEKAQRRSRRHAAPTGGVTISSMTVRGRSKTPTNRSDACLAKPKKKHLRADFRKNRGAACARKAI